MFAGLFKTKKKKKARVSETHRSNFIRSQTTEAELKEPCLVDVLSPPNSQARGDFIVVEVAVVEKVRALCTKTHTPVALVSDVRPRLSPRPWSLS